MQSFQPLGQELMPLSAPAPSPKPRNTPTGKRSGQRPMITFNWERHAADFNSAATELIPSEHQYILLGKIDGHLYLETYTDQPLGSSKLGRSIGGTPRGDKQVYLGAGFSFGRHAKYFAKIGNGAVRSTYRVTHVGPGRFRVEGVVMP